MKVKIKEYLHIIGVCILCFIFCLSFYYLLINVFHSSSISKKVYVSETDVEYKNYRNNLNGIKNNLDSYKYNKNKYKYDFNTMNNIYNNFNSCYNLLNNNNSILGNKDGELLGYSDVYNLNNYFINSLVDKCFTSKLHWISTNKDSLLKKKIINGKLTVDILANNALYVRDELKDNSSYYYNSNEFNMKIRNNLDSSYQMILHNYNDFSQIILELSNYLIRGEQDD